MSLQINMPDFQHRATRLRDPTHAIAYQASLTAMIFERLQHPSIRASYLSLDYPSHLSRQQVESTFDDSERPDLAIAAFAKATLVDETAFSIALIQHPPGTVQEAFPRLLAAMMDAINNWKEDPVLATDAFIGLSYFAVLDPSIGDHIKFLDVVLETSSAEFSLRRYLRNEAAVLFRRANYKAILSDYHGSLEDLTEAMRVARIQETKQKQQPENRDVKQLHHPHQYDFTGLTWSFTGNFGKLLQSVGRHAQALESFESVIDAVDSAFNHYPDHPSYNPLIRKVPVSPITGGRERDPHKLAKAIGFEYAAASLLLLTYLQRINPQSNQSGNEFLSEKGNEIIGDTNELRRRGVARYKSALAREATLPAYALPTMNTTDKNRCQALLECMPPVPRHVSSGVMECHACGSVDHQALKKCAGCIQAAYCSTKCQKKHWKEHKPECKKIQAQRAKKDNK